MESFWVYVGELHEDQAGRVAVWFGSEVDDLHGYVWLVGEVHLCVFIVADPIIHCVACHR